MTGCHWQSVPSSAWHPRGVLTAPEALSGEGDLDFLIFCSQTSCLKLDKFPEAVFRYLSEMIMAEHYCTHYSHAPSKSMSGMLLAALRDASTCMTLAVHKQWEQREPKRLETARAYGLKASCSKTT